MSGSTLKCDFERLPIPEMAGNNACITLPPELVKKARELGLNISKISENALKDYIRRLEGSKSYSNHNSKFSSTASINNKSMVDEAGFEPAASTMPTWRSFQADLPALFQSKNCFQRLFRHSFLSYLMFLVRSDSNYGGGLTIKIERTVMETKGSKKDA